MMLKRFGIRHLFSMAAQLIQLQVSIGGKTLEDGTKENRSYKGVTAHEVPNYGDLRALQYANENAGDVP